MGFDPCPNLVLQKKGPEIISRTFFAMTFFHTLSFFCVLHLHLPEKLCPCVISMFVSDVRSVSNAVLVTAFQPPQEPTRRVVEEGDAVLTFAIDRLGLNACTSHRQGLQGISNSQIFTTH